jgi:hypothetical protein
MNMKRHQLVAALGALAMTASGFANAQAVPGPKNHFDLGSDVCCPKDLKALPVSDKTPAELKKLAGCWAAQYNGVMNAAITFESLDDLKNIVCVHSVEIAPAYRMTGKLVARPEGNAK